MSLFDKSASHRSTRIGWRDTGARFLYDLATLGIPMSLASLKACCDAAADAEAPQMSGLRMRSGRRSFRLIPSGSAALA